MLPLLLLEYIYHAKSIELREPPPGSASEGQTESLWAVGLDELPGAPDEVTRWDCCHAPPLRLSSADISRGRRKQHILAVRNAMPYLDGVTTADRRDVSRSADR